jgi:hypothetical protein
MLDSDLAQLYQVDTKRLNEQIKRNSKRFPDTSFIFFHLHKSLDHKCNLRNEDRLLQIVAF